MRDLTRLTRIVCASLGNDIAQIIVEMVVGDWRPPPLIVEMLDEQFHCGGWLQPWNVMYCSNYHHADHHHLLMTPGGRPLLRGYKVIINMPHGRGEALMFAGVIRESESDAVVSIDAYNDQVAGRGTHWGYLQ